MREGIREEILKAFGEGLKGLVRELLENLMQKEREIYLEEHPTKANGLHPRSPHPRWPAGKAQGAPGAGRGFPSPDPSL